MDPSLFRYIWRHSRRDQILICSVVLASLPLYFASLDLPRRIVNEAIQGKAFAHGETVARFLTIHLPLPDWLGGDRQFFPGFEVDRYGLLFGLSGLFLLLVLVNGGFKYWINLAKGALGERMLRRMRYELFALVLRFTPESQRQAKPTEIATIIKDEVEPIGGFIGDAFILPAFLGTQAMTALAFILLQNVWLGLMAGGVVAIQFVIIPRLRRELLKLGRARQLASRRLAGRVGEVMDGMEAVQVHGAGPWERAEIGHRLFELFDLRLRIYQRKFMVKFLNNLLAQMTPFFFYAVGGYLALKGHLDIGQLVAVIAAYRDLPPPLKELIDWDQQRLDVQVKYDQVTQQFAADRLLPAEEATAAAGAAESEPRGLAGTLKVEGLTVHDTHGTLVEGVDLELALPARLALVSDGGPAASAFARALAGRNVDHAGTIALDGHPVSEWPPAERTRRLAYAGIDPVLFPGSLRENVVYGLRRPPPEANAASTEERRRITEAKRTGNPVENVAGDWIDYGRAGVGDALALDERVLALFSAAGLRADLYRFGLLGRVDPERQPELASRLIEARGALRAALEEGGMAGLVEPFDPARYNTQATLSENLLFGVPTARALTGRHMTEHPAVRAVLDEAELTDDLVEMGARIAATMTEIFRDLPSGHPLFEQFSFLSADELPDYEAILARRQAGGRAARGTEDRLRLLALPLAYIEPRHRLGLLDDALRERLVAAREPLRKRLEANPTEDGAGVEFYDVERVCAAAPLRDNLLFGRIDQGAAGAGTSVTTAITDVVAEMRLEGAIERVGLDHQVGPAGRLLTAPQRALVNLVRCLLRRPDVLVVDGGLTPLGETRARAILAWLRDGAPAEAACADRDLVGGGSAEEGGPEDAARPGGSEAPVAATLVVTLPNLREAGGFDRVLRAEGARLVAVAPDALPAPTPTADPEAAAQNAKAEDAEARETGTGEVPAAEAPADAGPDAEVASGPVNAERGPAPARDGSGADGAGPAAAPPRPEPELDEPDMVGSGVREPEVALVRRVPDRVA